jgi:hypothetical protein
MKNKDDKPTKTDEGELQQDIGKVKQNNGDITKKQANKG